MEWPKGQLDQQFSEDTILISVVQYQRLPSVSDTNLDDFVSSQEPSAIYLDWVIDTNALANKTPQGPFSGF